jgi:hypothetical protein
MWWTKFVPEDGPTVAEIYLWTFICSYDCPHMLLKQSRSSVYSKKQYCIMFYLVIYVGVESSHDTN